MSIPVHPRRVGKRWQIILPDAFAPTTYSLPPQESRTLALKWGVAHSVGHFHSPAKASALALPYGQQYCPHDAHLPNAWAKHGEETCKPPERDLSRLG